MRRCTAREPRPCHPRGWRTTRPRAELLPPAAANAPLGAVAGAAATSARAHALVSITLFVA